MPRFRFLMASYGPRAAALLWWRECRQAALWRRHIKRIIMQIDTGMRLVRTTELETVQAAIERAKPVALDAEKGAQTMKETEDANALLLDLANASDLLTQMLTR